MSIALPMLHDRDRVLIVEPGRLHPAVSFARSSTATYIGSGGTLLTAAINAPRYEYDSIGNYLGLLIEGARTNNVLNSSTLVTQTRTVTAVAQTLSFYGTGTVTLSGVATGTLVGTGASNRVTLTFTPTAGSLTLTVSGSCTNGQLEAGAFATSYIPTTGAAVTRSADVTQISTLSAIGFNSAGGTLSIGFDLSNAATSGYVCSLDNGGIRFALIYKNLSSNAISGYVGTNNSNAGNITGINALQKAALTYSASACAVALNNASAVAITASSPTSPTTMSIGSGLSSTNPIFGHVKYLTYYPKYRASSEVQRLTA